MAETTTPSAEPASGTADTTSAAALQSAAMVFGVPEEIGQGLVETWTKDGASLLVSAIDGALSREGCEGVPEPVLFVQPVDGSARRAAVTPDANATNGQFIGRAPDGDLVLLEACEGYVGRVVVGTESADGTITAIRDIGLDLEADISLLTTTALVPDGKAILIAGAASERDVTVVARVDLASGKVSEVTEASADTFDLAELADGTVITSTMDSVTMRKGEAAEPAIQAQGFDVSSDGTRVAFIDGDRVWFNDAPEPVYLPKQARSVQLVFSPDGSAVAVIGFADQGGEGSEGGDGFIAVVSGGKVHLVVDKADVGRVSWSPDSRAIAYNEFTSDYTVVKILVARALGG